MTPCDISPQPSRPTLRYRSVVEDGADEDQDDAAALRRLVDLHGQLVLLLAHDLRNPLTSILGYLELIAREQLAPLPEPLRAPLASMQRNFGWVRVLVDRVTALASLGQRRPAPPVDLAALVADVCRDAQPIAEHHRCHLAQQADGAVIAVVDPDELTFALLQLLVPCVKRATGATVTVRLDVAGDRVRIELGGGAGPAIDPAGTRWRLCAGLLALNGGTLELVQEAGAPRLRMTLPAYRPSKA